ncbi:hypothetical protein AA0118_g2023 [Alternaria tenuissima]|nr:hypothetical protein AA0118_g2023 [Alternaria tenuissima]RYO65852.1 hypothetical protein AA0116_g1960 [Alternaria tenuissima]
MPPKKDAAAGESDALLVGFTNKETKLLAAAFVSSTAPDKFDYDIMATLTGNTAGSLKKMWPPVKKKAAEGHASFAAFLGQAGVAASAAPAGGEPRPKPQAPVKVVKKRKATDEAPEDAEDSAKDLDPPSATEKSEGDKSDSKKKKVPAAKKGRKTPDQKKEPAKAKGRPKKAVKKEESASEEEVKDNSVENSADGGDGPCGETEDDI